MAELTGGHVHIAHMSARQSLRAVRAGKERGVRVTAEVAPHHFILTDEALRMGGGYDTNVKMNPPLREDADRAAMIEGLRDGSIDVIATDHAPHQADEKAVEFDRAPFGIVGLETAVSLCLDRLVHAGVIGLPRLVELLSANPARVLGLPGGTIREGEPADLDDSVARYAGDDPRGRAALEVEEHALRRLDAERRRGSHDRRRAGGVREPGLIDGMMLGKSEVNSQKSTSKLRNLNDPS